MRAVGPCCQAPSTMAGPVDDPELMDYVQKVLANGPGGAGRIAAPVVTNSLALRVHNIAQRSINAGACAETSKACEGSLALRSSNFTRHMSQCLTMHLSSLRKLQSESVLIF